MKVEFATKRLAELCGDAKRLRREYGPDGENLIRKRLDDLEAVPNVSHLRSLPGKFAEKHGDLKGSMAVHVHGGHRIIFRPAADPPPRKPDGGLDQSAIDAIVIEAIRDYH